MLGVGEPQQLPSSEHDSGPTMLARAVNALPLIQPCFFRQEARGSERLSNPPLIT